MKVFERPVPVNTDDIVNIIENISNVEYSCGIYYWG